MCWVWYVVVRASSEQRHWEWSGGCVRRGERRGGEERSFRFQVSSFRFSFEVLIVVVAGLAGTKRSEGWNLFSQNRGSGLFKYS